MSVKKGGAGPRQDARHGVGLSARHGAVRLSAHPAANKGDAKGGGPRQTPPVRPVSARPPVTWSAEQWHAALPPVLQSLDLTLTPAQQDKLVAYMGLLAHWNSTYNLTALRDPQDMLTHHLTDCLAVLQPLRRQLQDHGWLDQATPTRLLDVGSGGGLPGVVLAICFPQVQVTCVDTVGKKAAFIRQVGAELKLGNLRAEHARAEQLKGQYDVITSRAFASLLDFVTLTSTLMGPDSVWMAMKGKTPTEEQAALPVTVEVFHVEPLQVPQLDAERCVIWMRLKKN